MPEPAIQTPGTFYEGIPYTVQLRLVDKTQSVLTSVGLNTGGDYDLRVYDISTRGDPTLVHTETDGLNLATQDVAVTNGWDKDSTGWNAELAIDPAAFSDTNPVGGKAYKFELTVNSSANELIPADWRQVCQGRAGT